MFKLLTAFLGLAACSLGGELIPAPQEASISREAGELGRLVCGKTIAYNSPEARVAAELLASDLERIYGSAFSVVKSETARKGLINVFLMPWKDGGSYHRLEVTDKVMLAAATPEGLLAGSASVLQLAREAKDGVSFARLEVTDHADRDFRAVMIDVKNHWHPVSELKKIIDLARFYKINHLSLHTGEGQWIGALTGQMAEMPEKDRVSHKFYTKEEMEEVISYGGARGVYLFPHNECTPHFGHMVNAMKKDYVPGDQYEGFADELDGKGQYEFSGKADERWYAVMKIAIDKAIEQFAAGYPDRVLPYYHIGPVLGEGGMNPAIAARIVEMVIEKSPKTKVMFWNGISARDKALSPFKDHIVIAYYDDEFGQSDMNSYLKEGWLVANAAWSPLYIVGAGLARPVEKVYNDWHLLRQGSDGIPGGYGAITWEKADPKFADQVIGGMLATWETPTKYHLARLQDRVPAFAENAWKVSTWPYPDSAYAGFEKRLAVTSEKFARLTGQLDGQPSAPVLVKASKGSAKERIVLQWRSSGYNQGYHILRSTTKDPASAEKIASLPQFAQEYSDTGVETGRQYCYWVRAINSMGESPLSEVAAGTAGTGVADVRAYEPFDYKSGEHLQGANGGAGWESAWEIRTEGKADVGLDEEGLSYGDLPVSGGAFRLKTVDEKPGIQVRRHLKGKLGLDETTVWISYLFRAKKVGNGDVFIAPNGRSQAATGKNWGSQFAVYMKQTGIQIQPGQTYFLVARYEFDSTGDKVTLWVNPPLDQEPDTATASQTGVVDAELGNLLSFNLQGYGLGDYKLDELRLGESWGDVGGQVNKEDKNAPSPDVMTWINPPSVTEDGMVFMQAAEATDQSGVEYRFVCSDSKYSSFWQRSPLFLVKTGPGSYKFRVKARDQSANRNENDWSFVAEVTVP